MDSWLVLIRLDDKWLYRWIVYNDYGQPIAMSARGFWSKGEAENDLDTFRSILNVEHSV